LHSPSCPSNIEQVFDVDELRDVRKRAVDFAACFDPDLLDGDGAIEALKEVAVLINVFAGVRAQLARRVDVTHAYRQDGYRSAADGLLAMARAAATGTVTPAAPYKGKRKGRVRRPVPAKVIFRADRSAYERGWVEGDERCDIVGEGPVPVSMIRNLVDNEDPFV